MRSIKLYVCPMCGEASFGVINKYNYYKFLHPDKECKYYGDTPPKKYQIKFKTVDELKEKLNKFKEMGIKPNGYSFMLYKAWVEEMRKMIKRSGMKPVIKKVAFVFPSEVNAMPKEFWEIKNPNLQAQLLRDALGVDKVVVRQPGDDDGEFYDTEDNTFYPKE